MKRILTAVLVVAALAPTTANASLKRGPCHKEGFVNVKPAQANIRRRVDALIVCAEGHFAVPGGAAKALAVADCESSDWPWADNGAGDLGVFQVSSWPARARTYLKAWWFPFHWTDVRDHGYFNARANVLLALVWAHRSGWGAWSCA